MECAHPAEAGAPANLKEASFGLDVCLANGATVFVVFPAKITTEARGTYAYRKEPLGSKLPIRKVPPGPTVPSVISRGFARAASMRSASLR